MFGERLLDLPPDSIALFGNALPYNLACDPTDGILGRLGRNAFCHPLGGMFSEGVVDLLVNSERVCIEAPLQGIER